MKKNTIKGILSILIILCLVVMMTACAGNSFIQQPQPEEGAKTYEISGSCWVEKIDETSIKVHCSTNLMDGAVLAVSIDSFDGEKLSEQKFTKTGDNFYAIFSVEENWQKPVYANIVCAPSANGSQPSAVKEAYGKKFENLTGDFVLFNTEGNAVVIQSEPFDNF